MIYNSCEKNESGIIKLKMNNFYNETLKWKSVNEIFQNDFFFQKNPEYLKETELGIKP